MMIHHDWGTCKLCLTLRLSCGALGPSVGSRQLQPVVRFPDLSLLLINFSAMPDSKYHDVFVQYDVDNAVITDTIFSETGERALQGRE